jgi:predicted O-linked N-acetylglucosamine transferase (SPINDLY family)
LNAYLQTLLERARDWSFVAGSPLFALGFPGLSGKDHYRIAHAHACQVLAVQNIVPQSLGIDPASLCKKRLKVAYLSADFRRHAVSYLVAEVIDRHDRSRVEVTAYSTGIDDQSDIRGRLMQSFDRFIDASSDSSEALAQRIREDGVDVLVDLQGWTGTSHIATLAMRCAPVQVNWLGYPGTLGHQGLADYIIGDPIVTPREHAEFYSEAIAQMPYCYYPVDTTHQIPVAPQRNVFGLPESGFVYVSHNNNNKINPAVFDAWCRILTMTPDSVLWLLQPAANVQERLLCEAETRGIARARILFAPYNANHLEHLSRLQLADLALDTFPYNSHTTAVDALLAGVPLVTYAGHTFAGRVGASVLTSAGLADLVTFSVDDFCLLAVDLYNNRGRLDVFKNTLSQRAQTRFFNVPAFTKDIENLYFLMWQQAAQGKGKRTPIYQPVRLM